MRASAEQSARSSYDPSKGDFLRISKSSLMGYMMCPRQFYWRYIADIPRTPPTEAMIRGTQIHTVMEAGLLESPERMIDVAVEQGVGDDEGVDSMNLLLHQIAHDIGGFDIVEAEVKHELYEEFDGHPIIWVGLIDGVLRHPETGGLILAELKTGNMNMSKLGRTRKELVYYARLLRKLGYDEVTHFLYITPDYEVPEDGDDKLLLEGNKRGKSMWIGPERGFALMEPFLERSYNAFEESLYNTIDSLTSHQWPMKWNDYFCPMWCDFSLNCEAEMSGISGWEV
tara:strand:+ start:2708 stop:3559 length:852 start_codon:yes stop_codon:yes gene_type:complete